MKLGHNHDDDGRRYSNCSGCIEERWLELRLKGKTKQEADAQLRKELQLSESNETYPPSRQIQR